MVSFHQVKTEEKASHVIIEADNEAVLKEIDSNRQSVDADLTKVKAKATRSFPSLESNFDESDQSDSTLTNVAEQSEAKPRSWLTYLTYLQICDTYFCIKSELPFSVWSINRGTDCDRSRVAAKPRKGIADEYFQRVASDFPRSGATVPTRASHK
uniref:Uncharacterized protein n=1 Tax=Anopheles christyi TaxID=43041 RepID=A0A182JWT0_9DIPT